MSSAEPDTAAESEEETTPRPLAWRTNLLLFGLTVVSVFVTATLGDDAMLPFASGEGVGALVGAIVKNRVAIFHGAEFTVALLAILLAHEFGHYIAARIHKVDTSLPYFIPLPLLSPFGTMGAIIRMRGAIPTRRALLDIGASGPLAGLCLAIPIYYWGASHSQIIAIPPGAVELGDSLLLQLLDHLAAPNVPDGKTLLLSPIAFAAWGGMFVTMINLLPIGQLDGGHVAYSLFGKRQDAFARNLHRAVLLFFAGMLAWRIFGDVRAGRGLTMAGERIQASLFWFMWFQMLALLGTLSRKNRDETIIAPRVRIAFAAALVILPGLAKGHRAWIMWSIFAGVFIAYIALERKRGVLRNHGLFDHPPAGDQPLGLARSVVAIVTLLFFIALFMPTPFSI